MKPSPFAVLNETVSAPPSVPADILPPPAPPATAAPFVYEPADGNGLFGGAGGVDLPAMSTDPPDIGGETRRLLWQKGVSVANAPSAAMDRFCCINGPCRYYSELHVDEPETLPAPTVKVVRLCRRFLDDDGAHLEMSDATLTACTDYAPPWWSPEGFRMKLIVAWRLSRALERISGVNTTAFWNKLVKWRIVPAEALEDVAYGGK